MGCGTIIAARLVSRWLLKLSLQIHAIVLSVCIFISEDLWSILWWDNLLLLFSQDRPMFCRYHWSTLYLADLWHSSLRSLFFSRIDSCYCHSTSCRWSLSFTIEFYKTVPAPISIQLRGYLDRCTFILLDLVEACSCRSWDLYVDTRLLWLFLSFTFVIGWHLDGHN